jgi:hypothetical protein
MSNRRWCGCKQCKKAKRKGLILGTRLTYKGGEAGPYSVSDYVPWFRFRRGRRPDPKVDVNLGSD